MGPPTACARAEHVQSTRATRYGKSRFSYPTDMKTGHTGLFHVSKSIPHIRNNTRGAESASRARDLGIGAGALSA